MISPLSAQVFTATSGSRARFPKRVFCFPGDSRVRRTSERPLRFVGAMLALVLVLALLPTGTGAQDQQQAETVADAVGWLLGQQAEDGGFPGFSGGSDPGTTADAVIALVAARSLGIEADLEPALVYLGGNALVLAQTGPGSAAKLSLALAAAGLDPHDFNSIDPLSIVEAAARSGLIGFGPFDHALGILALAAAGEEVPEGTIAIARDSQGEDGGWAFDGSTGAGAADTNTTALVIQALVSAGLSDDEVVARGIAYLLSTQAAEGGFPYQPGGPIDANSTALSLQALIAADGVDDALIDSAQAALSGFQNENGSFSWMFDPRDENMFATLQAIPAAAGLAMPIKFVGVARPVAATPEATPVAVLRAA